jgi:hypothetical protein
MAIRVGKVAAIGTWPWLLEATNHFGGALSTAMDRHLSRECAASLSSEPAGDLRRLCLIKVMRSAAQLR